MELFLGKQVMIHFNNSKVLVQGILTDLDDDSVYILSEQFNKIISVPKNNVLYISSELPASVAVPQQTNYQQNKFKSEWIKVSINGEFLTNVEIPAPINTLTANEALIAQIYKDQKVQTSLHGKIQKTMEYEPGELNIILVEQRFEEKENKINESDENSVSFSIGGNATSNFLSPTEMVQRLSNIKSRSKKDEQTKV